MTTRETIHEERETGAAAAQLLLREGVRAAGAIEDPLTDAFAAAVVDGLAEGMRADRRGWIADVMEGTGRLARNLNVEAEHGLIEVIQNADDLGATTVRFAMALGGAHELLVVHDGERVRAPHVLAMTLALVSTKGDDAMATGKFGIGLKTLTRLAGVFEVHSPPYRFRVVDQALAAAAARASVPGVWEADGSQTLLALALRPEYPEEGVAAWFRGFGAESLLFLRTVRRLELCAPDGRLFAAHVLEDAGPRQISLSFADQVWTADEHVLAEPRTGRSWTRIGILRDVPAEVGRSDKATPSETPLAVAYADRTTAGRVFAGLPLALRAQLPFCVNAQFDTDASRTTMVHDDWNDWLLRELGALAAAAALHRLPDSPADGWSAIPLRDELDAVDDRWLHERLLAAVAHVHARVREDGCLPGADGPIPLRSFVAETAALDHLLGDADLRLFRAGHAPLVRDMRDANGRWRRVVDELELGDRVRVQEALEMLRWPAEQLGERPAEFFMRLAACGLAERLRRELEQLPFLVLADGTRLSPAAVRRDGMLIVTDGAGRSLGHQLGVVRPVDGAFRADDDEAQAVREFLRQTARMRDRPSTEDALHALAQRDAEQPVHLADAELIAVRDALRALDGDDAAKLAAQIGARILVDGQEWVRGRLIDVQVVPAHAYLPAAIEGGGDTWARAAGRTPELRWIHRRYARDMRPSRAQRERASLDLEADRAARTVAQRQRLGARSLFTELGAGTAPRLRRRANTLHLRGKGATGATFDDLGELQRQSIGSAAERVDGLVDDWTCPDLEAVCRDIARGRVADGRPRALALLSVLGRAWSRLYAERATARAVHAYMTLQELGPVPATWCARAAEIPWMTSQSGARRAPLQLRIQTPAFRAILGEAPRLYAHALDATHAASPAVRALGFESEAHASTLVDRLEELRAAEERGVADPAAVARLYDGLAALSPPPSARGVRRRVDDLPVGELQRRFGAAGPGGGGLVRTTDGGWHAPGRVFIGRPIFGAYERFASEQAEALWLLLGMRRPTIRDCVVVLRRVAEERTGDSARTLLLEVYRHVTGLLEAESESRPPPSLRTLPLWTSRGWTTSRPLYAVADPQLERPLGEHVGVWSPPELLERVRPLADAAGVFVLPEDSFGALGITRGALSEGRRHESRLHAAITHLRAWLALEDPELHDRLTDAAWEELQRARVAVNRALQVEIPIPGRSPLQVARRAHMQRAPVPLFAFAERAALDDAEAMGGELARLFAAEDRERVVLAHGWLRALRAVDEDEPISDVRLSERASASVAPDGAAMAIPTAIGAPPPIAMSPPPAPDPARSPARWQPPVATPLAARRLQSLDELSPSVAWAGGDGNPSDDGRRGPRRGRGSATVTLVEPDLAALSQGPGAAPGPLAGYTGVDRETLGLRLVTRELARGGLRLTDTRRQQRVGADAVDQHGDYYELKVHGGELPDAVTLTPSEFERARRGGERFVLVLVAGLEQDQRSSVTCVRNPLAVLSWAPELDVRLSGIRRLRAHQAEIAQSEAVDE